jgi:phage/plasmid-associated DNA primase
MGTQVTFTMQIKTSNDAYQDQNHRAELARTLRLMIERIEDCQEEGHFTLFDTNGARVGNAVLEVWEV